MKKWQQRVLLFGGIGLFIVFLITESVKDAPYSRRIRKEYIEPFVEAELDGVIISVRRTDLDLDNLLYGRRSQQFYYRDIKTNAQGYFDTGLSEPIQAGDTLRKKKGANRFVLIRRGRLYESYPIDARRR